MVSGRNLNSSKLSCISLPARMRMIDSKMMELECSQDFSHYKSMGFFFQALKGSLLRSPWSDLAEFRTRPRCYGCPRYLQV